MLVSPTGDLYLSLLNHYHLAKPNYIAVRLDEVVLHLKLPMSEIGTVQESM